MDYKEISKGILRSIAILTAICIGLFLLNEIQIKIVDRARIDHLESELELIIGNFKIAENNIQVKKELKKFLQFLQSEFNLTIPHYYTRIGMVFGLVATIFFGFLSLFIGVALGTSIGLIVDEKAKKVTKIESELKNAAIDAEKARLAVEKSVKEEKAKAIALKNSKLKEMLKKKEISEDDVGEEDSTDDGDSLEEEDQVVEDEAEETSEEEAPEEEEKTPIKKKKF